jgi:hypothetical protein
MRACKYLITRMRKKMMGVPIRLEVARDRVVLISLTAINGNLE